MVLALYAASAFVMPTLAPVATTDDWGYGRAVEILYHDHRLTIFPVIAATAIFQVLWGALFAALFGMTLGVVRLSTVAITFLAGWALYGLCRRLGVRRSWSALGAAAYLFNPLTYVLSFTFMTDAHFTALLIGSTFFYARGLGCRLPDRRAAGRAIVVGSALAGCAFLARQQGILIPAGVVTYLLLSRRLRPNRGSTLTLIRALALPALAVVGYYLWLRWINDVPAVQQSFLREAKAAGWDGTWALVKRLTFVEIMYFGIFTLPITVAALSGARLLVRSLPSPGWLVFAGWEAVLIIGLVTYSRAGQRMPYIPQFGGPGGLGAPDVLGTRPRLVEAHLLNWLTAISAISALILGAILVNRLQSNADPAAPRQSAPMPSSETQKPRNPETRTPVGLVLSIGLWQVIGVLPPSYHYRHWSGSLDRYLLPLLPFIICLSLWAVRDLRPVQPLAWLVVAGFAFYAVAGTRDYLVYMDTVWDMAHTANAMGVQNTQLDAGSAWDGYHLYEYSLANHIRQRTPGGPWWTSFYAPATDSTYVVAGRPIPGYVEIRRRSYSSWLESEPTNIYLMRRGGLPNPPTARQPGWSWGWGSNRNND